MTIPDDVHVGQAGWPAADQRQQYQPALESLSPFLHSEMYHGEFSSRPGIPRVSLLEPNQIGVGGGRKWEWEEVLKRGREVMEVGVCFGEGGWERKSEQRLGKWKVRKWKRELRVLGVGG